MPVFAAVDNTNHAAGGNRCKWSETGVPALRFIMVQVGVWCVKLENIYCTTAKIK